MKRNYPSSSSFSHALVAATLLCGILSGCMSNGKTSTSSSNTNRSSTGNITIGNNTTTTATTPFTIPTRPSDGPMPRVDTTGDNTSEFKISLIALAQTPALGTFCSLTSGENGKSNCRCYFQWTDGTIIRRSYSLFTSISNNALTCPVPSAYNSMIDMPNGTTVKLEIITDAGKSLAKGSYVKGASNPTGVAVDQFGTQLFNISRYSCYEKFARPIEIASGMGAADDPNGNKIPYPYANIFCYRNINPNASSGSSSEACSRSLTPDTHSVQSFYYSLYTNNPGAIHESNERFYCPKVNAYTTAQLGTTASADPRPWPLDAQFSLAYTYSPAFSVPVSAPSLLGSRQSTFDANLTKPEACMGEKIPEVADADVNKSMLYKCLGYAMKAKSDGSCDPIRVLKSACTVGSADPACYTNILTYRLRRYHAIYPITFDTNGAVVKQQTAMDTVYVLDRCGEYSNGGGAEVCRKTIAGPKPCPFAWYDKQKVVDLNTQRYYGTNDILWDGKNVDGIKFPNMDTENSCSALLPIVQKATLLRDDRVKFVTTHVSQMGQIDLTDQRVNLNNIYIRPTHPWAPSYIEDTDFQACAPKSFNGVEPPLYFTRSNVNSNLVSYCAAIYPTDNWVGTSVSPPLADQRFPANTPYFHRRIELTAGSPPAFDDPPLLAPMSDIKNLLKNDTSYSCGYTSRGDSKDRSPAGGCCSGAGVGPGAGIDNTITYAESGANNCIPPR